MCAVARGPSLCLGQWTSWGGFPSCQLPHGCSMLRPQWESQSPFPMALQPNPWRMHDPKGLRYRFQGRLSTCTGDGQEACLHRVACLMDPGVSHLEQRQLCHVPPGDAIKCIFIPKSPVCVPTSLPWGKGGSCTCVGARRGSLKHQWVRKVVAPIPSVSRALSPLHLLLCVTKHRFKDKIINNFKGAQGGTL